MAIADWRQFGSEALTALGIDPDGVRSFTLRVQPGDVVTVECEHVVTDDNGELTTMLRRYEVHEIEDGDDESG